jgi:predicted nucleic acid-binding protein
MVKLKAVVDSSFWINLNKADLVKYLFDYFDLYFTEKVEDELSDYKDTRASVPKDLDSFIQLKKLDFVQVKNPKTVSKKLSETLSNYSGEIYTIALAEELNAIVLVDDYGPTIYCENNKIGHLTSVTFIAMLFRKNKITKEEAKQKINLLKRSINKEMIIFSLNKLNGD